MMSTPVLYRLACTAVLTAVLCAGFGCTVAPVKSEAQRQADREVAQSVQAALNADKQLYARHIFVRADNGVVRLYGFVWETPELYEAKRVAEHVPGVSRVVNDLELERNGMDNSGVTR